MKGALLQGRVALVTGAGRGIGREIALLMAREGARVVVNDLGASVGGEGSDASPGQSVTAEIRAAGGEAAFSGADVSSREQARSMVEEAVAQFGGLDIVVNNAGILRKTAFLDISEDEWNNVLRVNLGGTFHVSQAAAQVFRARGRGVFVHMTSTAGLIGAVDQAHYSTSKLAVTALSRSIALELHGAGVRSNCISPIAATRMMTAATGRPVDAPPERAVSPEGAAAVAPLAVYLASDQAAGLTGQILGVRGSELYLYNQSRPVRVLRQDGGWTPQRIAQIAEPAWRAAFTPLERTRDVLCWPAG